MKPPAFPEPEPTPEEELPLKQAHPWWYFIGELTGELFLVVAFAVGLYVWLALVGNFDLQPREALGAAGALKLTSTVWNHVRT